MVDHCQCFAKGCYASTPSPAQVLGGTLQCPTHGRPSRNHRRKQVGRSSSLPRNLPLTMQPSTDMAAMARQVHHPPAGPAGGLHKGASHGRTGVEHRHRSSINLGCSRMMNGYQFEKPSFLGRRQASEKKSNALPGPSHMTCWEVSPACLDTIPAGST